MNSTMNEVKEQLKGAASPIIKVLRKNDCGKVIVLGFNKNVKLNEHQTAKPAMLLVLEGSVRYTQGDIEVILEKHQQLDIPVNILHAVTGMEESICILFHD